MGSDKKPKDKSRKRPSNSQSEDESPVKKKHRSRDGDGDGDGEASNKTKSHRRSGKAAEKKHKSKDSKRGRDPNDKFTELTNDDYFAKNNEFSTWLKEEKKKFFSDLSTDSARELFSEFVKEWNTDKLKSKFYKGIKTGPRSSHKWKIKN